MRRRTTPNDTTVRPGRITSHTWGGYRRFLTINQKPAAEPLSEVEPEPKAVLGIVDPDFDRDDDLFLDTHSGRYQRVMLRKAA